MDSKAFKECLELAGISLDCVSLDGSNEINIDSSCILTNYPKYFNNDKRSLMEDDALQNSQIDRLISAASKLTLQELDIIIESAEEFVRKRQEKLYQIKISQQHLDEVNPTIRQLLISAQNVLKINDLLFNNGVLYKYNEWYVLGAKNERHGKLKPEEKFYLIYNPTKQQWIREDLIEYQTLQQTSPPSLNVGEFFFYVDGNVMTWKKVQEIYAVPSAVQKWTIIRDQLTMQPN